MSEQKRIQSERLAAIGTLAATMAHEIRNPLNAMSLLLSTLERKLADRPETQQWFQGLRTEIARLDRMISDILDYAKPLHLEHVVVDTVELIQRVAALYKGVLDTHQIQLGLSLQTLGPVAGNRNVFGDRDKLEQCIVNLLQNAIDAVRDLTGDRLVAIESEIVGENLRIVVTDNGPGISADVRARMFDLFYTTKEKGTGLGLSTVRKIIDAHGGEIDVRENAPRGTRVRMTLPIASQS